MGIFCEKKKQNSYRFVYEKIPKKTSETKKGQR